MPAVKKKHMLRLLDRKLGDAHLRKVSPKERRFDRYYQIRETGEVIGIREKDFGRDEAEVVFYKLTKDGPELYGKGTVAREEGARGLEIVWAGKLEWVSPKTTGFFRILLDKALEMRRNGENIIVYPTAAELEPYYMMFGFVKKSAFRMELPAWRIEGGKPPKGRREARGKL